MRCAGGWQGCLGRRAGAPGRHTKIVKLWGGLTGREHAGAHGAAGAGGHGHALLVLLLQLGAAHVAALPGRWGEGGEGRGGEAGGTGAQGGRAAAAAGTPQRRVAQHGTPEPPANQRGEPLGCSGAQERSKRRTRGRCWAARPPDFPGPTMHIPVADPEHFVVCGEASVDAGASAQRARSSMHTRLAAYYKALWVSDGHGSVAAAPPPLIHKHTNATGRTHTRTQTPPQ